jgi:hypothetical protein
MMIERLFLLPLIVGITGCSRSPPAATVLLQARLVAPQPGTDGCLETRARRSVEVAWEVMNLSNERLEGLFLRLDCQCRAAAPLPPVLLPGETAVVRLTYPTPDIGILEHRIPIVSSINQEVLAELRIKLRTPAIAPLWVYRPEMILATAVAGEPLVHDFELRCIERLEEPPIFSAPTLIPSSMGHIFLMTVEETPVAHEGAYCQRRYRAVWKLSVVPTASSEGRVEFTGPAGTDFVRVRLNVVPAISLYPQRIRVSRMGSGRVQLVNRSRTTVPRLLFDNQLLDVIPSTITAHEPVTELQVQAATSVAAPTTTLLSIGSGDTDAVVSTVIDLEP